MLSALDNKEGFWAKCQASQVFSLGIGSADVRYPGQVYELTIQASGGVSNFSMV